MTGNQIDLWVVISSLFLFELGFAATVSCLLYDLAIVTTCQCYYKIPQKAGKNYIPSVSQQTTFAFSFLILYFKNLSKKFEP